MTFSGRSITVDDLIRGMSNMGFFACVYKLLLSWELVNVIIIFITKVITCSSQIASIDYNCMQNSPCSPTVLRYKVEIGGTLANL